MATPSSLITTISDPSATDNQVINRLSLYVLGGAPPEESALQRLRRDLKAIKGATSGGVCGRVFKEVGDGCRRTCCGPAMALSQSVARLTSFRGGTQFILASHAFNPVCCTAGRDRVQLRPVPAGPHVRVLRGLLPQVGAHGARCHISQDGEGRLLRLRRRGGVGGGGHVHATPPLRGDGRG